MPTKWRSFIVGGIMLASASLQALGWGFYMRFLVLFLFIIATYDIALARGLHNSKAMVMSALRSVGISSKESVAIANTVMQMQVAKLSIAVEQDAELYQRFWFRGNKFIMQDIEEARGEITWAGEQHELLHLDLTMRLEDEDKETSIDMFSDLLAGKEYVDLINNKAEIGIIYTKSFHDQLFAILAKNSQDRVKNAFMRIINRIVAAATSGNYTSKVSTLTMLQEAVGNTTRTVRNKKIIKINGINKGNGTVRVYTASVVKDGKAYIALLHPGFGKNTNVEQDKHIDKAYETLIRYFPDVLPPSSAIRRNR